ncbi:PF09391 family protein [Neorhizobium galegae bv. orientalis]|nr:PF09391 family protein [Neorhizobium galegae bv. orientalis]
MFDTKIAIVLRDDLAPWQELNVTAFLTSGIIAQNPAIIGQAYRDAAGHVYNPMSIQPMVVLTADQETLRTIHRRSLEREVTTSAYIEEMFSTGHDAANREVFAQFAPEDAKLVGLALRAEKKIADKITKGAKMHK